MSDPTWYSLWDVEYACRDQKDGTFYRSNIPFCFGFWNLGAANESTRKRVIFYTVGEYIFLAAASGLQILYIRKLFSKSVAYNRVWT